MSVDVYNKEHRLTTQLDNIRSTKLTLESLKSAFLIFGEFVEDVDLKDVRTENILASCHNLKIL